MSGRRRFLKTSTALGLGLCGWSFDGGRAVGRAQDSAASGAAAWATASGRRGLGRPEDWDSERGMVFASPGAPQVDGDPLVRWGGCREPVDGSSLVLIDGGVLQVEDWKLDGRFIELPETPTGLWTAARWPRSVVAGAVLQWPAERLERDRLLARLLASDSRQDEAWLDDGDRLQGELIWSEGRAESPDGATGEGRWSVRTSAGDVPAPRDRLVALAFGRRRPLDALDRNSTDEPPVDWIGLRDGSRLAVRRCTAAGAERRLELTGGAGLAIDRATLMDELVWFEPFVKRVRRLSDLTPIGYKHVPFLAQAWPWMRDANVCGGRLRAGGRLYRKGIGMHSSSRLAYDLDGRYESLQAELAVDDLADGRGSVVFRVYLDVGAGAWKAAYESPVVRGGDPPAAMQVDLRAARRMALIVDFADRGDERDYADWLDARLVAGDAS